MNTFATGQSGSARQNPESFFRTIERIYLLDEPRRFAVERRAVQRKTVTMPVTVTPLDEKLQPLGYQHYGVTRDISPKGAGMVTTNPLGHRYVHLEFEAHNGERFELTAKVVYCNDLGYYYQSGCEFLAVDGGENESV